MDILEQALLAGIPPEQPTAAVKKPVRKAAAVPAAEDNDMPWLKSGAGEGPAASDIGTPDIDALESFNYASATPGEAGGVDAMDATKTGLGALGGLFSALGDSDRERNKYDLPGAGGSDMPSLGGVDKPFQGRLDITPEQRQSLALALLR